MVMRTKSTTKMVYEFLATLEVGTRVTRNTIYEELSHEDIEANHVSATLAYLERHDVVKAIAKDGKHLIYEFLGKEGDGTFYFKRPHTYTKSGTTRTTKGRKIRNAADFGLVLPSLTNEQRKEVVREMVEAGVKKPPLKLSERLLELVIEVEEMERELELARRKS
jgi:hypothetical protein